MPMSMYGELIVRPRTSPDCHASASFRVVRTTLQVIIKTYRTTCSANDVIYP